MSEGGHLEDCYAELFIDCSEVVLDRRIMSGRGRTAGRGTFGNANRSHPYARETQFKEEEEDDDLNTPANAIKVYL